MEYALAGQQASDLVLPIGLLVAWSSCRLSESDKAWCMFHLLSYLTQLRHVLDIELKPLVGINLLGMIEIAESSLLQSVRYYEICGIQKCYSVLSAVKWFTSTSIHWFFLVFLSIDRTKPRPTFCQGCPEQSHRFLPNRSLLAQLPSTLHCQRLRSGLWKSCSANTRFAVVDSDFGECWSWSKHAFLNHSFQCLGKREGGKGEQTAYLYGFSFTSMSSFMVLSSLGHKRLLIFCRQ